MICDRKPAAETTVKPGRGRRVLMLLENNPYPRDGRVRREAECLARSGYQVTVISPGLRDQVRRETIQGVRVYRFPAPAGGSGLASYLWEYGYSMTAVFCLSLIVLFRHGFDVIHAHNPPDTFALIAALYKLLGKKFVFDHHDLSPEMYCARFNGSAKRLVYHALVHFEKLSCRLADHVIATNQSYREVEIRRGGVPSNRITIVRNGPDLERIKPVEADAQLRRRAKTLIGYVGILGFQDGIELLLQAMVHLRDDCHRDDVLCVVIGTGDARDSMMQLARELGIDSHVWFPGYVSDAELVRWLSTVDICVDPDPSNPFTDRSTMIKMMEYMALGKPIVAFDLPEHRVTAANAACYALPNDTHDFARKIATLIDDPRLREQMGRFGRQRTESQLAWPHQEKHLLGAYETLTK